MKADFFTENRQLLINEHPGGVFIFSGYSALQRSNDMAFSFQQEANFYWLSGIVAADWWMIIDGIQQKTYLVQPTLSETHEIFEGSLSAEAARAMSGADEVLSTADATALLK